MRLPRSGSIALVLAVLPACKDEATPQDGSTSDASTTTDPDPSTTTGDPDTTTGGPGAAPPAPTLMSPTNGAEDIEIESDLCWNLVEDPDGDPVRYKVYVDGIELMAGRLENEGYDGPCLPRLFAHEQTYEW